MEIAVAEAAERAGSSERRVRALIGRGDLPARRVGGQWMIDPAQLDLALHNLQPRAGRPLSQQGAWRLVQEACQQPGRFTTEQDLHDFRRRCRRRAQHSTHRVHPSLLGLIDSVPGVFKGGADAAVSAGIGVEFDPVTDVYVAAGNVGALLDELHAVPLVDGANVVVHSVDDDVWMGRPGADVLVWLAWLDLADRRSRSADMVIDRLIGRFRGAG